jgi:hypothetical protein
MIVEPDYCSEYSTPNFCRGPAPVVQRAAADDTATQSTRNGSSDIPDRTSRRLPRAGRTARCPQGGRIPCPGGRGARRGRDRPTIRAGAASERGQLFFHQPLRVPGPGEALDGVHEGCLRRASEEVDAAHALHVRVIGAAVRSGGETGPGAAHDGLFGPLEDPQPELEGEACCNCTSRVAMYVAASGVMLPQRWGTGQR